MKIMNKISVVTRKLEVLVCATLFIFHFSFFNSASAQDSVRVVELPEGQRLEMVWVDGGSFTMGSNAARGVSHNYEATRPEHTVTVDGFYIARFEVTQGVWKAVVGENPSKFASHDSLPVEQVSWTDAQQFVVMLSQQTGYRFRLPTEAEWEYAARGGSKSRGGLPFAGCNRGQLERHAWFCVNSERTTHKVGTLTPNGLGLYDMSGNVAEWCSDWMEPYSAEAQVNPRGGRVGSSRVLRGGHYNSVSAACTVYDRSWYIPSATSEYFGLRVVMEMDMDN